MTDELTGVRLGNYEVRDLLGSGGMGSVYRGYDPSLEREVAIKVISAGASLPDYVERFRREARLAAGLRHPNIVHVYAFGEANERLYMVQELLPGPSLEQQLRKLGRRRLGAANVRRIVGQLAAALDYAHERGVVHRDVKPGNALYNSASQLALTDFGLARDGTASQSETGPGVIMGTPSYVAPEQAVGSKGVTKASDIYALGVLLFELLTGRLPFEADTPMGVVLKHLYDQPPLPSTLRAELPKGVDAVVMRALRKEPRERFASAGALAAALDTAWPLDRPAPTAKTAEQASPARTKSIVPKPTVPPARKTTGRSERRSPAEPTALRREPAKDPKIAQSPSRPGTKPGPPMPAATARAAVVPTPTPRRSARMLVGLATACVVGTLLLLGFGVDIATLGRGFSTLLQMAGR